MLDEPTIVMEEVLEISSQEHDMTRNPHAPDRQLSVVLPSRGKTYTSHLFPMLSREDGAAFMQRLQNLHRGQQSTFDGNVTSLLYFLTMQKFAVSVAVTVPVSESSNPGLAYPDIRLTRPTPKPRHLRNVYLFFRPSRTSS